MAKRVGFWGILPIFRGKQLLLVSGSLQESTFQSAPSEGFNVVVSKRYAYTDSHIFGRVPTMRSEDEISGFQ